MNSKNERESKKNEIVKFKRRGIGLSPTTQLLKKEMPIWDVRYPALFRFCRNKEASVAELMLFANGVLFWDVSFFRGVHVQDLEALSDFMESIYASPLRGLGEDKMC